MKMICELRAKCPVDTKDGYHCHIHERSSNCSIYCLYFESTCIPYGLKHKMMKVIKEEENNNE
jgi:hypothetical protein